MTSLLQKLKQTWDHTRLKDTVDPTTGDIILRRAQHVIVFDAVTGQPVTSGSGTGGTDQDLSGLIADVNEINESINRIYPSGISRLLVYPAPPLNIFAPTCLAEFSIICRSIQIQAIRPDGTDNRQRIAIGDSETQSFYLSPGDVWSDSAPLGQTMDLAGLWLRALEDGDAVTVLMRL